MIYHFWIFMMFFLVIYDDFIGDASNTLPSNRETLLTFWKRKYFLGQGSWQLCHAAWWGSSVSVSGLFLGLLMLKLNRKWILIQVWMYIYVWFPDFTMLVYLHYRGLNWHTLTLFLILSLGNKPPLIKALLKFLQFRSQAELTRGIQRCFIQ